MSKLYFTIIILSVMGIFTGLFGNQEEPEKKFPPVPAWEPENYMTIEAVVDRFKYYTDGKNDFVVYGNGTCVIVPDSLSDAEAINAADGILADIFGYHPDMNPKQMDDGNILIFYNHPAYTVLIVKDLEPQMGIIRNRHLDGLTQSEVLMTPMGPNKFDEFGMKALYGRSLFFMDAKNPKAVRVVRKSS
ncbi:hypothetical protein [Cerasicoccus fimbriatus]|uniref:hypothetical protein n=1 Tax=Cerasicoccus fimbriatus TaxID=3014554 RepID=UPI0022B302CD|nr:hypothetical protein [Cerasicoccus sp. TK19100]